MKQSDGRGHNNELAVDGKPVGECMYSVGTHTHVYAVTHAQMNGHGENIMPTAAKRIGAGITISSTL